MLEELFHVLGVRTTGHGARLLGYAREVAALQVRHRRCRQAWRPHIQATRNALLTAAANLGNSGGTALIVGGGTAHDLPIAELLEHFNQLILMDIAFAYPTRRLAKRWPGRIVCYLHDVTGVVAWLARHRSLPPPTLVSQPRFPDLTPKPDWVASVNCLTQLPLLPVDWLHDHGVGADKLETFGRTLIQAHLDWLKAWQTPICLITEIEDRTFDRDGILEDYVDFRPLLQEFLEPAQCLANWSWDLKPPGELANGATETRIVAAYVRD